MSKAQESGDLETKAQDQYRELEDCQTPQEHQQLVHVPKTMSEPEELEQLQKNRQLMKHRKLDHERRLEQVQQLKEQEPPKEGSGQPDYMEFIRMHYLSSDLHLMHCEQPLPQPMYMNLYMEMLSGNVNRYDYPMAHHPGIEDPCEHPRHPVITEGLWDSNDLYDLEGVCPVCSIRLILYQSKVIREIWLRNADANDPNYYSTRKLWHTVKSHLENEILELEDMAALEDKWEQDHPEEHTSDSWSARAALAIAHYAEADRIAPPMFKPPFPAGSLKAPTKVSPKVNRKELIRQADLDSSKALVLHRTTKPAKKVTFHPLTKRVKGRAQHAYYRADPRYTPGRHASPSPEGWADTSFSSVEGYGIDQSWRKTIGDDGKPEWVQNLWVHMDRAGNYEVVQKGDRKNGKLAELITIGTGQDMDAVEQKQLLSESDSDSDSDSGSDAMEGVEHSPEPEKKDENGQLFPDSDSDAMEGVVGSPKPEDDSEPTAVEAEEEDTDMEDADEDADYVRDQDRDVEVLQEIWDAVYGVD